MSGQSFGLPHLVKRAQSGHLTLLLRCLRQFGCANVGCAEMPPFASAAIAHAETPCICSMPVAAMQLLSPKRSLKFVIKFQI
jgi:hypothetical protein